ncbi:MAG: alpha/beta fold hydrolase [Gaiellales bacterium]
MSAGGYYSEAEKGPHDVLELGAFELECGVTLPSARLLYKTHGQLNAARDNAILFPHMYSGSPSSLESAIAPGRALDPERWFVVCPGQFGNGFSTSPSNVPAPLGGGAFPTVTIGDDVLAQHRLVTEVLGVDRLALVLGFSMGAQQAYEWAVRYPDMVERLAAVAGTAKTTAHNAIVVGLAEDAIRSDQAWQLGHYQEASAVRAGLRLHAHVWSATGLSPELYRTEGWREAGFESLEDLVRRLFEDDFAPMDPNNLLAMCWKWRHADVSRHTDGDLAAALGRISAKTRVMPFATDMLFTVDDCSAEQQLIPGSELRVIESLWGHYSWEATEAARTALDHNLNDLLAA